MALVNFSLPYQSVTMAPFLYASSTEGYTTAHSLHLNTMSRSGSTMIGYDEQESFRKEPYTPPIRYHQHQGGQSTQKNHEVYMEHMSFSTQDTLYNMYNQDLRSTRSRHQQQIRPPSLPSSFQYQQSPKHIKTRIEDQQNQPERPIGYAVNEKSGTNTVYSFRKCVLSRRRGSRVYPKMRCGSSSSSHIPPQALAPPPPLRIPRPF
ncbi:hypothetical protein G5I_02306 [Acromyrmex echinatior]|uniref:Uncharacterized protein n=1 Tax=Acromyrmex echinatior TaxID=103372 RepID=F4W9Z5_ACREC|nr:hypothetical protein G5I_02306 [Acromyrmex echinatior]